MAGCVARQPCVLRQARGVTRHFDVYRGFKPDAEVPVFRPGGAHMASLGVALLRGLEGGTGVPQRGGSAQLCPTDDT